MPGESQQTPATGAADPSVFTSEAIHRAAQAERDFVISEIKVITTRLNAMDEATKVLNETVTRTPTDIEKEVSHLRELMEEKFDSVNTNLDLVERGRVEQKKDTKDAVDAALAAAKEAVKEQTTASEARTDKSEATTTKSIDQLGDKFDTAFEGQRRDSDDLKARVAKIESLKQGAIEGQGASSIMDDQLAIIRRELASLAEKVSKIA